MASSLDSDFLTARSAPAALERAPPQRSRAVAAWLFIVAAMVFGMVILGGSTRLTESGLSITQWKPITGALPPLSQSAWLGEFHAYQQIPQFRLRNPDMTLDGFKTIFWWEWSHRLLGRIVGVAFTAPFLIFWLRRTLPTRLVWRCWVLLALGGLQGLVGWWMVASGLSVRTEVAPERLTVHLGLALAVFCGLVWTGLEAWAGPPQSFRRAGWPAAAAGLAGLVFFQILLGGLVAGNRAGLIYNDWPMFAGRWLPSGYWDGNVWRTVLHSLAAVQLHHRLGAYLLFVLAWVVALLALRSRRLPRPIARLAVALAAVVSVQALLGIATLMMLVPLGLAVAHQATAAVLLALAIGFAWRTRRA